MGSGNLGDKIRTYNWPNNRITDHRIGAQKFGLDEMFSGELLQEFIEELIEDEKQKLLTSFL
jgi:peptide chain release factor 1